MKKILAIGALMLIGANTAISHESNRIYTTVLIESSVSYYESTHNEPNMSGMSIRGSFKDLESCVRAADLAIENNLDESYGWNPRLRKPRIAPLNIMGRPMKKESDTVYGYQLTFYSIERNGEHAGERWYKSTSYYCTSTYIANPYYKGK